MAITRKAVQFAKCVAVVARAGYRGAVAVARWGMVFARRAARVAHGLYAAATTFCRGLFNTFVPRTPKIVLRPEFLVVSEEVVGLIKPFLKHHPRNRDAIAPALAA